MKATKIFMMAALALTFAACSNDDNDLAQQPAEQPANGEITITATLEAADDAKTRSLSDPDGENKIQSTWETTDEFAILYNNGTEDTKSIATVKSINASTVTITFTIPATLADNTACKIVYPASAANATNTDADVATALATQDGVLATAPDIRVGTATINKTTHSLESVTKLAAQNAVFKFTLEGPSIDATHPLVIKDNSNKTITTITPASTATSVYVAMPAAASTTYKFIVDTDDNKYLKSGTATIEAGKYYQTTLTMTGRYPLAMASATADDLGSLLASDGKIYATGAAATAASTTAIGVIAYLGTDNFTENGTNVGGSPFVGHGLVLCLKNLAQGVAWSSNSSSQAYTGNAFVTDIAGLKRSEEVSGYSATTALATDATTYPAVAAAKNYTGLTAPTGTTGWFLPSAQQWVKMQTGLGALEESSITWNSWFDTSHTAVDKWEAALSKAGSGNYDSMTSAYSYYWSSSEYSASDAVILRVKATGTGDDYGFHWTYYYKFWASGACFVRPVLAF